MIADDFPVGTNLRGLNKICINHLALYQRANTNQKTIAPGALKNPEYAPIDIDDIFLRDFGSESSDSDNRGVYRWAGKIPLLDSAIYAKIVAIPTHSCIK